MTGGRVLQRKCGCGAKSSGGDCAECRAKLHRQASGAGPAVAPPIVHQVLASPGQPLPASERAFFEPRFGHDFSQVRIHTDDQAAVSAEAVRARAYTVGTHITFARGNFVPHSTQGRELLAHELTHVTQHGSATASDPLTVDSPDSAAEAEANRLGALAVRGRVPAASARIAPRVSRDPQDTHQPAAPAAPRRIHIPWRSSFQRSYVQFLLALGLDQARAGELATRLIASHHGWQTDTRQFPDDAAAIPYIQGMSDPGFTILGRTRALLVQETGLQTDDLAATAEALGGSSAQRAGERILSGQRRTRAVRPNDQVLTDPEVANHYLSVLEHFAGLDVTPYRAGAADGLNETEVDEITSRLPLVRTLTDRYTQGYTEFRAAGGRGIPRFAPLIEQLIIQYKRGNPNALANLLVIKYGKEDYRELGIVFKPTDVLCYNRLGQPIPSTVGLVYRDDGYRGSDLPALGTVQISDPGLELMIAVLRHQFVDPGFVVAEAIDVYMHNIDRVNAEVRTGLTAEIAQKFEDMLIPFIGFLAGSAVANFLARSPNPTAMAIGVGLKLALSGVGYVMQIDATATAMERLLQSAYFLSRVEQTADGNLTTLSEDYLKAAAEPIREMVIEIAMSAGAAAIGGLIRAAKAFRRRTRIRCTFCELRDLNRVDPDVDAAVERGIVEEATTQPNRVALRPGPPPQTGLGAAARERFDRIRDAFAQRLGVSSGGQVHHAIELQVLDRYRGAFTEAELNAFENMRGIGTEAAGRRQLHNSKVREILDREYVLTDREIASRNLQQGTPEYNDYVRRRLTAARDMIDYVLGQFFTEYRTGRPRQFD